MIPLEILRRYEAGERNIHVSPQVFKEYVGTLTMTYRRVPDDRVENGERSICYKDARVWTVAEYAMNTTGLTQCAKCGEWYGVGDFPFCTKASGHSKGFTRVNGDETDYVDHNLGPEPIRITSWSQRRQLMAERGLMDYQHDVEVPEGMAPNAGRPSRWGAYRQCDPEHLAWLASKLSTGKAEKAEPEPAMPITIREWVSE